MAKQAAAVRSTIHTPRPLTPAARRRVEAKIEELIHRLDAEDGDADDNQYDPADPPAGEGIDDNELDDCGEDLEPSLAASEGLSNWSSSATEDLEADGPAFELNQAGAR